MGADEAAAERLRPLTETHQALLLVLAHFADDDGRIADGIVEALEDGRLRISVGDRCAGPVVLVRTPDGTIVAEIPLDGPPPAPRRVLPGLPS